MNFGGTFATPLTCQQVNAGRFAQTNTMSKLRLISRLQGWQTFGNIKTPESRVSRTVWRFMNFLGSRSVASAETKRRMRCSVLFASILTLLLVQPRFRASQRLGGHHPLVRCGGCDKCRPRHFGSSDPHQRRELNLLTSPAPTTKDDSRNMLKSHAEMSITALCPPEKRIWIIAVCLFAALAMPNREKHFSLG